MEVILGAVPSRFIRSLCIGFLYGEFLELQGIATSTVTTWESCLRMESGDIATNLRYSKECWQEMNLHGSCVEASCVYELIQTYHTQ